MKKLTVIGLTGSIGMGKSTAAELLGSMGVAVYSADAAVHNLLGPRGAAVKKVAKLFPAALDGDAKAGGAINRKKLGELVFNDKKKLKQLEAILHPLVRKQEKEFLQRAKLQNKKAAVLEIPLLFETGGEKRCDVVVCVTAPLVVQRARVLKRKNMTPQKLRAILAQQMPDREKRKRADFVVNTGKGRADTRAQLKKILQDITE